VDRRRHALVIPGMTATGDVAPGHDIQDRAVERSAIVTGQLPYIRIEADTRTHGQIPKARMIDRTLKPAAMTEPVANRPYMRSPSANCLRLA
jgi:hypothetical protein